MISVSAKPVKEATLRQFKQPLKCPNRQVTESFAVCMLLESHHPAACFLSHLISAAHHSTSLMFSSCSSCRTSSKARRLITPATEMSAGRFIGPRRTRGRRPSERRRESWRDAAATCRAASQAFWRKVNKIRSHPRASANTHNKLMQCFLMKRMCSLLTAVITSTKSQLMQTGYCILFSFCLLTFLFAL